MKKRTIMPLIISILALIIALVGMIMTLGVEKLRPSSEAEPVVDQAQETIVPTQAATVPTDAIEVEPDHEELTVEHETNQVDEADNNENDVDKLDDVQEIKDESVEVESVNQEDIEEDEAPEEIVYYFMELEPYAEENFPDDGAIIYTTGEVNVRSEPSMNGKILGRLEKDARIFRYDTANGWSRIYYNGDVAYIANKYVNSIKIEPFDLYEEVDEVVYSGHDVNLRLVASTYGPSAGKLLQGESARRIGIGKNGWSQVIYKNQLFFVNSRYLSTDPNFKIPLSWFLEEYPVEDDAVIEDPLDSVINGNSTNENTNTENQENESNSD